MKLPLKTPRFGFALGILIAATGLFVTLPSQADEKKYKIAFVVANVNDGFYQKAHQGAVDEAQKLGVELLFQGPTQFSAQAEIPVVDTLLAQHPDAIAIAPADPTALIAPLKKWADAKIPIVTYDGYLTNPPFPLVSEIMSANYDGGRLAGEAMGKLIGGKGKVAIIDLAAGLKVLNDRRDGFIAALKEKYPDVQIVDTQLTALDFPRAQTIVQTYVNKYPDLAGIFCTFSFATEYGGAGLLSVHAQDRVKLVGFEAGPKEIQLIKQGVLKATVAQKPAEEAKLAVEYGYYQAAGQTDKIEKKPILGDVVIDANNVDSMSEYYYAVK
jgi:ribose transport system substrate-binding protein